jgi:hypothetical protein
MKKLFFIFTVFLLFGCEESKESAITFNDAQPVGTSDELKLPKKLYGRYINPVTNSVIIINKNTIEKIIDVDYKTHINELDSSVKIDVDTLINLGSGEKIRIKIIGDTLVYHIHTVDTLFNISTTQVLRKYKGYYFLNTKHYENSWSVKKLSLSKGVLILAEVSLNEDLEKLQTITGNKNDTVPVYEFNVSKKQFKTFVKQNGFNDGEVFLKQ